MSFFKKKANTTQGRPVPLDAPERLEPVDEIQAELRSARPELPQLQRPEKAHQLRRDSGAHQVLGEWVGKRMLKKGKKRNERALRQPRNRQAARLTAGECFDLRSSGSCVALRWV